MDATKPWFEFGRAILDNALQDACNRIDLLLAAEQRGDSIANDELHSTKAKADSVEAPIRGPGHGIPSFDEPPVSTAPSLVTPASLMPLSGVDENTVAALQSDNAQLRRRFNALSQNFKKARDALQKRKDERDKWMEHATYLEGLIDAAEKEHGIQILQRADQLPGPSAESRTDPGEPRSEAGASPKSGDGTTRVDSEHPPALADVNSELPPVPADFADAAERVPGPLPSDSTQGEEEESAANLPTLPHQGVVDEVSIKEEPSSDVPVVVSERMIRKRKHEDAAGPSIKAEAQEDSSPIPSGGRYGVQTQESLDLDDIENRIETPRKRKDQEHSAASSANTAPRPRISFATPTAVPNRQPLLPKTAFARSSALTPLSVNVRLARSVEYKPRDTPRQKRHLGHGIGSLAEDGGVYGTTPSARRDEPTDQGAAGRLSTLLNSPSAAEDAIISRSAKKRRGLLSSDERLPIPQRRELPFDKVVENTSRSPLAKGEDAPRLPSSSHKRVARDRSPQRKKQSILASSLRGKPPSELRLDDFKINPLANDGHDFAYTEVVRDRDDRACLPGCTDMHCCGKQFRALALSQRPDPPLTPAQRVEEQKLLEEYLGDYAYRLATMNREERDELWVEAKTQELANKYGKHRHRFSRMQSPPGFWNADFPSTQELEADKAEAAKREKQAIMERYREAMRPGGRWMFKDE
ncbi:DNA repair protein Sae2/CtIP [Purpureocillium lilacinum]|nr:DNA repair protein Sae2/CtIP [Purpureocillium lilacinum]